MSMREGFRGFIGGLLAAGGVAANSGEVMAQPAAEKVEHHEQRENTNLEWATSAQVSFDVHLSCLGDTGTDQKDLADSMADIVRDFVREYNFPTRGKIVQSGQGNPMRVLNGGEWRQLRQIAMHFLANSSVWGKVYPNLQRQLTDVVDRIDAHLDEPGPTNAHKTDYSQKGKINRSLGYK